MVCLQQSVSKDWAHMEMFAHSGPETSKCHHSTFSQLELLDPMLVVPPGSLRGGPDKLSIMWTSDQSASSRSPEGKYGLISSASLRD